MKEENMYMKAEERGRKAMADILGDRYLIEFTSPKYDTVDYRMTAATSPDRIYVGDVKAYLDPKHPRALNDYEDYMVDYSKLKEIKKKALNEKRIPVLIGIFQDCFAVWNLNDTPWENTAEWRLVVVSGVHYGKKEWELMAHLPKEDGKIWWFS